MATDAPILLVGSSGEPYGRLRAGALTLVVEAEARASRENLAKSTAITMTLEELVTGAGYHITPESLQEARQSINQVRRGELVRNISIIVRRTGSAPNIDAGKRAGSGSLEKKEKSPMANPTNTAATISFFEAERTFPNDDTHAWYESLKGLNDHKQKLLMELEMLLYPERLEKWSERHHKKVLKLCERTRNRVPLILFEGDVGTGKTALAETIGDALARKIKSHHVHLLKINTQVRGTGQVGEMSDLIAQAFTQAEQRTRSLKGDPVLLLLDEADALAASRDVQQMHHEDKAGLNTLLQRLDNLRPARLPIATLFITNRPDALDPAIRRRAALTLRFERPDDVVRAEIFRDALPELKLTDDVLSKLVRLTGPTEKKNRSVPFTASDITDRLLPGALRAAYAENHPFTAEDLLRQAEELSATPPFGVAAA